MFENIVFPTTSHYHEEQQDDIRILGIVGRHYNDGSPHKIIERWFYKLHHALQEKPFNTCKKCSTCFQYKVQRCDNECIVHFAVAEKFMRKTFYLNNKGVHFDEQDFMYAAEICDNYREVGNDLEKLIEGEGLFD